MSSGLRHQGEESGWGRVVGSSAAVGLRRSDRLVTILCVRYAATCRRGARAGRRGELRGEMWRGGVTYNRDVNSYDVNSYDIIVT